PGQREAAGPGPAEEEGVTAPRAGYPEAGGADDRSRVAGLARIDAVGGLGQLATGERPGAAAVHLRVLPAGGGPSWPPRGGPGAGCRRVGHLLADARSGRAGAGRCPCGDFPYTRAAEMPQVGTTVTVATAGLIAGC